jgi:hypothetical protein
MGCPDGGKRAGTRAAANAARVERRRKQPHTLAAEAHRRPVEDRAESWARARMAKNDDEVGPSHGPNNAKTLIGLNLFAF